jgi:hypothetical protein
MKFWLRPLAALLLLAHPALSAEDELAGEKETISRPLSKPASVELDQGGPVTLSRSAMGASQPSFELPEFVITGGGERKAVSSRPELSTWMDTSGGIKASPSEADASKGQVGAQAGRQTLAAATETARPAYGEAQLLYGLANTLEAGAFYGQEWGPFFYLLQGEHDSSDGGPASVGPVGIPVATENQFIHDMLQAHGGWRLDGGSQLGLELGSRWRERLLTQDPLPDPWTRRSLYQGGLSWEGAPSSAFRQRYHLDADQAQVLLPGLGRAYEEGLVELQADLEKELLSRQSRTVLVSHLYAGRLDQNDADRSSWLLGGWLMARIEAWQGGRLSLGISLDSVSGGVSDMLVAPRAEFEQRLGGGLGLWARFNPGLELPTLTGLDGLFDKDQALPGTRTQPSKDSSNLEAGISAALPAQVELEIKGLLRQNENSVFLDDPRGQGLWMAGNVNGASRVGVEVDERAPLGGGFSERLSLKWQSVSLTDSPGLEATFAPALEGEGWLQWRQGPWSAGLGAVASASREGRLAGGDTLPAYTDLRITGGYDFNAWLSLMAQARNLLGEEVEEFSGYADPAPFVGAGLKVKF